MDRAVGRYMLYAGGMRALKPPFVCCWFDSCLWLQVRGGRSEHLRCQHSQPPRSPPLGMAQREHTQWLAGSGTQQLND
jgi:hypothetical protein